MKVCNNKKITNIFYDNKNNYIYYMTGFTQIVFKV